MKLTKSSILKVGAVVALLALPAVALAAGGLDPDSVNVEEAGFATEIFGCADGEGVLCILENVLMFLLALAFIVAVIFLVIGGFRYIVSQGNDDAIGKAKGTITNAIIGLVVIVLAWVILTVIFDLLETGSATGV